MSLTIEQAIAQVECLIERGKIAGPVDDSSKQAIAEQFVAESLDLDKKLALSHVEQARRTQNELAAANATIERVRARLTELLDHGRELPDPFFHVSVLEGLLSLFDNGATNA